MANKLTIGYIQNGRLNVTYQDLAKLDRQHLRAIAKRLFENANRRLINIRANHLTAYSESATQLQRVIGKAFHARGLSDKELVDRISLANWFMGQPTSTVKGAKIVERDVAARLPNMTPNERREYVRFNQRMVEKYPLFFGALQKNKYDSTQYRDYSVHVYKDSRDLVLGGVGGDLFSRNGKDIKATADERFAALKQAHKKIEEYIQKEMDRMFPPVKGEKKGWGMRFTREEYLAARRANIDIEEI